MKSMITLGDIERRGMRMVEVACHKCERRGRLSIARLIAEHGRDDHSDLCALIAHDCPRMRNPAISIYERWGVHLYEARRVKVNFGGPFLSVLFVMFRSY